MASHSELSNLLSKVTIIIPTYERYNYALRNMRFWSDKDVTVHVLDGSAEKVGDNELSELGTNILYHHIPDDLITRHYFAKNLIDTKYVIYLSDDEIFIPSALAECVKYLDAHNETASCIGRVMGFKYENNNIVVTEKFTPIKMTEDKNRSFKKRLIFKASNFLPSTIFGLHRKNLFSTNLELIKNLPPTSPYTAEVLLEFSNSIHGQSKVIDKLMWLRSFENDPINNKDMKREIDLDFWYLKKDFKSEVVDCINEFTRIVSNSTKINEKIIKRYVNTGLNIMCKPNYAISDYASLILSYREILKARIARLFGKHMYSGYKNRFGWISFEEYKEKVLDPENISFNPGELSDIFDFIKNTHINS
jgi:glycosyltransferase domain-containing protein